MDLLSFDIGTINLAYCQILVSDGVCPKVWKIASLKEKKEVIDFDETMKRLLEFLKTTWPPGQCPTHVIIENQPCLKNPSMKSIQIAIYTYFALMHVHVSLISASNKLKVKKNTTPVNKKTSYAEKKKLAITLARMYITETKNEEMRLFFERSKKQDDLSDAYLQALFYIENLAVKEV